MPATQPVYKIICASVSGTNGFPLPVVKTRKISADLMLEDEFIGVVFADDEDGELCYHVQISILDEDLEDS